MHEEKKFSSKQTCKCCVADGKGSPVKQVFKSKGAGVGLLPHQKLSSSKLLRREYYAGTGHLPEAIRHFGIDTCEYELFKNGEKDVTCDMTDPSVIDERIALANAGFTQYCHFGIVCSSWGIINRTWNGGTRTPENSYGDNSLARERLGNVQLRDDEADTGAAQT